jgi:hypothetical protein
MLAAVAEITWGMSMIVVAPLITWTVFVVPGWL